ncbi:uncharacterized protein LOC9630472 isoform X2 [Selaginella moellendorffii]|uniref:uncharacterized protein LOC9630472 isoform X2 n=1 Tax=Selaginella moellendorffii TaxID=88036 RepID=UPI000D1CA204|nr:uncharacterized protein LOC9630472 isoform X2 [Selaginella moellendorffii]|eukprot:XP_024538860.1 uncharacterized protein LOC9630472 isoform X2 [Selaginella moellendorffii]
MEIVLRFPSHFRVRVLSAMEGRGGGGGAKRLQSKVISSADGANHRKDKWATERHELPVEEEGRGRRRLQDPVALEDANNAEEGGRRPKRGRFETQNGENPEFVPRAGAFFEHDDRNSNWRSRTTPRRRPFGEGSRPEDRGPVRKPPEERWEGGNPEAPGRRNQADRWHHDRFLELENKKGGRLNGPPPRFRDGDRMAGRRGGFPRVNGRGNVVATQMERGRWGEEEAGGRNAIARNNNNNRFRGPVVANPRGAAASEWKHDLFDQRNHSPAAQREEASVARVEALLAS